MLPKQREMVKELKDQPFTLLGINSDRMGRSALKKKLEKEKITWPNLHEGEDRAVSEKWNIQAYPTIFILDKEGVIQARGHMGEKEIEKKVKELLKKAASV